MSGVDGRSPDATNRESKSWFNENQPQKSTMRPGGEMPKEKMNCLQTAVQEITHTKNGLENKNQPPTKYQVMEGKKEPRLTHSPN